MYAEDKAVELNTHQPNVEPNFARIVAFLDGKALY